jgi:O-antigen ligase
LNGNSFSLSNLSATAAFPKGKSLLICYPAGILGAQLFLPKAVSLFFIGWIIHLLFVYIQDKKFLKISLFSPLILIPGAYWLLHVIGLVFSTDTAFGMKDLETKFSFLLLPTLFMLSQKAFNKTLLRKFFLIFLVISLQLCWLHSLNAFWDEIYARENNITLFDYPYYNYFFSSYLSYFLHPGYFSMFLLMGVYFLFEEIKESKAFFKRLFLFYALFVFLVSIIFLSSKSGIIALLIGAMLLLFKEREIKQSTKFIFIAVMIALVIFAGKLPWVSNSFSAAIESFSNKDKVQNDEGSSSLRMISWTTAVEIWKENPMLGCGSGDVKNELISKYRQNGNTIAAEKKLNAHSQVLQSMAALGIPGLLLIFAMLFLPFWRSNNAGKYLGIVILIFGFTESIFETQAGVIFYCMMLPWVYFTNEPKNGRTI